MTLYGDDSPYTMDATDKRRFSLPLGDDDEVPSQECPSNDLEARATGKHGRPKRVHAAGLSTPDVASLALTSPELENIIISGSHTFLVSNGPALTPTSCGLSSSGYTEQQLRYSQGFLEALKNLQSTTSVTSSSEARPVDSICPGSRPTSRDRYRDSRSMSGEGSIAPEGTDDFQNESNDSDDKAEAAGSSPWITWNTNTKATPISRGNPTTFGKCWDPHNPVKLDSSTVARMNPQERATYRAARKRARNRLAASRCREKKLRRQNDLEGVVQSLADHNTALNTEVFALRDEVCRLKEDVMRHAQSGCRTILLESSLLTVRRIQAGTK